MHAAQWKGWARHGPFAGKNGGWSMVIMIYLCGCALRRQAGCKEAEDVLRPYSALGYAWDEPALPHSLVLALPGNRRLGTFNLDKARHAQC